MQQAIEEAKKMIEEILEIYHEDEDIPGVDGGRIHTLQELIERLEEKAYLTQEDGWISVDIGMPIQGKKVMTKSESRGEIEGYYVGFWHDTEMPRIDGVTHWQPLPLPPTT